MIPTLNSLSESPGSNGSPALVASTPDGAQTAEPPVAVSFEAILTNQESATLPPGGNPQHPGGKALPLLDGMEIEQEVLDAVVPAAVAAPDSANFFSLVAPAQSLPAAELVTATGGSGDGTQAAADDSKLIPVHAAGQTAVDALDVVDAVDAVDALDVVDAVDAVDAVAAGAAGAAGVARVVDSDRKFAAVTAKPDTMPPAGPVSLSPARQAFTPVDFSGQGGVSPNAAIDTGLFRREPVQSMEQTPATLTDVSAFQEFVDAPEGVQARTPGSPSLAPLAGTGGMAPTMAEAAPAAGPRPELMSKPPGDPGWGNEFVGRVSLLIKNGSNEARLQLNPAELGQLDIKITTEGDRAVILFTVQHGAAREAIDLAMPRLREMLEQSGLQLAHSEVADHSQSERGSDGGAGEWDTGELGSSPDSDGQADDVEESSYRVAIPDTATVDYYA